MIAREAGYLAESINGDAFSDEIKQQTIDLIRANMGQVDMVVYSLASPRRTHPKTGEVFSSVLKPLGEVTAVTIEAANEEEIRQTVAVMGGEDWEMWIHALQEAGVLADGATTLAYSYIGPEITQAVYREGTIGRAKDHLEATALSLNNQLQATGGRAYVSVNKALVTQSSSAIPVVPLYISLLFKVMKEKGLHEGCIEQMYRLFSDQLFNGNKAAVDEKGRIRVDDWEMRSDVQNEVDALWSKVSTDNLGEISDIEGYRKDFFKLFGFEVDSIDYDLDVTP
ncbi:unnamed protein product [Aphanomyces euteiches]